MKKYLVRLPIAGVVNVEVEASCEKSAINQALSKEFDIDFASTNNDVELEEIEAYEKTSEGNVNYTSLWEAEAEVI